MSDALWGNDLFDKGGGYSSSCGMSHGPDQLQCEVNTVALTFVCEPFEGTVQEVLGIGMAEELYRTKHKQATVVVIVLTG